MNLAFFATPELAVPTLLRLGGSKDLRPAAVFTQPPARRSRRGKAESSPVGNVARELGLELHEVESVNEGPALERLREIQPDVIVVVAFGQILKRVVLDLPQHGCLNLHPSMLPLYRGAAPVQRAVLEGVVDSGLTVMRLVKKLDAGPVLLQRPWRMEPSKTAEELLAEAGEVGSEMVIEVLRNMESIPPREQDHARATFAPMLSREDGILNFALPAVDLHNRVRAVQPWPRAECWFTADTGDKRVIVHRTVLGNGEGQPGRVLGVGTDGITVACGGGALTLAEVQLEGKPRVHARDAANGLRIKAGAMFRLA